MATTQNEHPGNGQIRRFSFTFPYIKEDDVKVSVRTSNNDVTPLASTAYTFPTATEIELNTIADPTTFQVTSGAPKTGVTLRIFRETDIDNPKAVYYPGSSIRAQDLNDNTLQNLYAEQERQNRAVDAIGGGVMKSNLTMEQSDIVFEGDTVNHFETTLTVVNPSQDRTIRLPNVSGTVITTGDVDTVTSDMLTNNIDIAGNLDVAGLTVLDSTLQVGGSIDANGNLDVDGTSNLDNVDIDGTVHVQGTSTFVGAITANGGVTGDLTGNVTGTVTGLAANAKIDASEQVNHTPNDDTYYTTSAADQRFWRQDSAGNEIVQVASTWTANDSRVATTGAIENRIVSLVDQIGGFIAISNETSFPASNPDIDDNAGTVVSIAELTNNLIFDANGSVTISAGTTQNDTVTITGGPPSTQINSGSSILVITTTTLHTYTWHRSVASSSDIGTVANISNEIDTVADNIDHVEDVAGVASHVASLGPVATEIGELGVASVVSDMSLLAPAAVREDMSLLGTAACVNDMALLAAETNGTAEVINDMALLAAETNGTAEVIADMALLADKTAELGRLGTADCVADMDALAAETNGVAEVINNMAALNATGVIDNMAALSATGVIDDMALLTATGVIDDMETCADNISDINNFAKTYFIAAETNSGTPSGVDAADITDGDLWYDTTNNVLRYYNGSLWPNIQNHTLVTDPSPQLGAMLDVNGKSIGSLHHTGTEHELIKFIETPFAVNEFSIKNAATGDAPELRASGNDTNVDVVIRPKNAGNVQVHGSGLNLNTADITGTGNINITGDITLTSTDDGTATDPELKLYRNSADPESDDKLGKISFWGKDDNNPANALQYACIYSSISDETNNTTDGRLVFNVISDSTETTRLYMSGAGYTGFYGAHVFLGTGVNLIFEGATNDTYETTLTVADPTADRTITLPDATGTVLLDTTTTTGVDLTTAQTLENKTLDDYAEQTNTPSTNPTSFSTATAHVFIAEYDASTTISSITINPGKSMLIHFDIASGNVITWPTIKWVGGSAPTLNATGHTIVELWCPTGTDIYGATVGDAS